MSDHIRRTNKDSETIDSSNLDSDALFQKHYTRELKVNLGESLHL